VNQYTLTALEVRRLRLLGGVQVDASSGRQALRYLAARLPVGALGGLLLLLLALGISTVVLIGWNWARGEAADGIPLTTPILLYIGVAGIALLFVEVTGLIGVAALERRLARRFLGPSPTERLERRIAELAATRAGVVAAVDQERRRIERDLHDGVQQRLVNLAMLIGRARRGRSPELLDELLDQAHLEARGALDDLREVAWRVHPTALDALGLQDALAAVAERAGIPVKVCYALAERPPSAVETAAYFVVSEGVTNAVKHAQAEKITVGVRRAGAMIVVRVHDDGLGGADPAGGGLSGLARRVAALDGRFRVDSPHGGPTTLTAELPCG
jgi:signal transduction histidine kinase